MKLKNKKTIAFVYIFMVLGCIKLMDCPKTNAFFTTNKDDALIVDASVISFKPAGKLTIGLTSGKSFIDSADFTLTLMPNKDVTNYNSDTYRITIPTGCSISNEQISHATPSSIRSHITKVNDVTYDLEYTGNLSKDLNTSIDMTCPIDSSKLTSDEDLSVSVNVSEKVDSFERFVYTTKTYTISYLEYDANRSDRIPDNSDVSTTETDVYTVFKKWIEGYALQNAYKTEIEEYIAYYDTLITDKGFDAKTSFNNKIKVNVDSVNILPGLNIRLEDEKYKFNLEPNFIGYARTYYENTPYIDSNIYFVYLSNLELIEGNKDLIETAFDLYLKNYVFYDSNDDYTIVKQYIQEKGGVFEILLSNKYLGIYKTEESNKYLINKSQLLDLANKRNEKSPYTFKITNSDFDTMLAQYMDAISIFSSRFKTTDLNPIRNSALSNATTDPESFLGIIVNRPENGIFMDFFMVKTVAKDDSGNILNDDTHTYVLFKVWANDTTANYIRMDDVVVPEGMKITVKNSDDSELIQKLYITINYDVAGDSSKQAELDYIVTYLEECLGVPDGSLKLISNVGNDYAYEIEKSIIPTTTDSDISTATEEAEAPLDTESVVSNDSVLAVKSVESAALKSANPSTPEDSKEKILETMKENALIEVENSNSEDEIKEDPEESTEGTSEEIPKETAESTEQAPVVEDDEKTMQSEEKITPEDEDTKAYNAENNVSDKPKDMDVEESIIDKIPPIK